MSTKKDIKEVLGKAKESFRVESAAASKKEEITNFFKLAYVDQFNAGDFQNENDIIKRWEWANIKNPHIEGKEFPAWFCKDKKSGEITGHAGIMPVSIKIKNKHYPAVWGRDMIVPLKWRRQGIASLLFTTAMEETKNKAALFLLGGANDYAVSIYRKLGFIYLGRIPLHVRIIKFDGILRKYLQNNILLKPLNFLGGLILKIFYLPSWFRMHKGNGNICIKEIQHFDKSFDTLWKKASVCFPIIISRDSINLNWRFVHQPYWDYRIFKAENKKDGELTGYAVLRQGQSQGLRIGVVSDFFTCSDDAATMISLVSFIIRYFEKKGNIDLIKFSIMNKKFEHILRKLGFISIRSASHFMAGNVNKELDQEFIVDRNNWFINYADTDLDLSGGNR